MYPFLRYDGGMLSLTVEYALRAVVALSEEPDSAVPLKRIAKAAQVPADYLAKVMRDLVRAGIVASKPGRTGGYSLEDASLDRSLWDVATAVESVRMTESCPLGKPCHALELCPLHRALRAAELAFAEQMRGATLRSLRVAGTDGRSVGRTATLPLVRGAW